MKNYFFYTFEGYTESPNNKHIENMQVLGRASGLDYTQALDNLLRENEWITDSGFNKDSIIAEQILDDKLKENINNVIHYLWKDEKKHYEKDKCENHIYLTLKQLKKSIG